MSLMSCVSLCVRRCSVGMLVVACVGAASTTLVHAQQTATQSATTRPDFARMVDKGGSSLVTIKYILESDGEEQENEVTGTLIAGDGLVLASNFFFGGGPFGGAATPKEIKILHGEDTTGVDAKFIARDTELGLAWLKVEKAPTTPYPFIDFAASAEATLGEEVFAVRKMGKFFGTAFSVAEGRVSSIVSKPRALLIPTIGMATRTELALPVYNAKAQPVGVNTYILPDAEEMSAGADALKGADYGMILPAKDVVEATKKALDNTASDAEATTSDAATPPATPQAEAAPAQPK